MRARAAFTLAEMLISLGASVVVIGGLLAGSIGIQRTLHNSEVFSAHYSNSRRIVDCVARDLRRAIAINIADSSGATVSAAGRDVELSDSASAVFILPGYYRSNAPGNPSYDEPLPVVNTTAGPTYGSGGSAAPRVTVSFRKFYVAREGSVCLVREEDGARQTIVRSAEHLHVALHFTDDARGCTVEAWFRSPFSGYRRDVATSDRVMLRNVLEPSP